MPPVRHWNNLCGRICNPRKKAGADKSRQMGADRMKTYSGKSVYGGIAIGRINVYKKNESMVLLRQC